VNEKKAEEAEVHDISINYGRRGIKLTDLVNGWLLAFGFWLLAFGFWLLAFGFWLLAFGFWLRLFLVPCSWL
jgi:hypothetical protein